MNFEEKLDGVVRRYEEIEALLTTATNADELTKLNKEFAALQPVVEAIKNYQRTATNMQDAKTLMDDSSLDKEMRDMAQAEFYELKEKLPQMEHEIKILLTIY